MDIVSLLNIVIILLVFIIFGLGVAYFVLVVKDKTKKESENKENVKKAPESTVGKFKDKLSTASIRSFMEFDEVKDNMIIRKNREQYVMVIQCQGVNYDLMSEDEKIAVEEGFVQFLNTLRFPIQLYVQTRSLNLRDIVDEYKIRVRNMEEEIEDLKLKQKEAEMRGNEELAEKIAYQIRRKENVFEYGADISDYVGRMSLNKNVLQQKTYIIVSYFANEFGSTSTYSNEEIDNICFSELFTRTQSVIRSLAASEVGGRILDSEELAELLYIAYNRDDSELMQLGKALDAQYDALYSTSKDVLIKKQEKLEEELNEKSVELATESIMEADKVRKEKKQKEEEEKRIIGERALALIEQYKDQMEEDLYEETKNIVKGKKQNVEVSDASPEKTTKTKKSSVGATTGRPKKTTKEKEVVEEVPAKRGRRKLNTEKIAK